MRQKEDELLMVTGLEGDIGRDDDELPEQVLLTARICRFDLLERAKEVEL